MRVRMTDRHKWMLVAGVATTVAAPLAERALAAAWRGMAGEEPPADAEQHDVDWGRVVARRGAGVVWEQVTGSRPPAPRKRGRRLAGR